MTGGVSQINVEYVPTCRILGGGGIFILLVWKNTPLVHVFYYKQLCLTFGQYEKHTGHWSWWREMDKSMKALLHSWLRTPDEEIRHFTVIYKPMSRLKKEGQNFT